MSYYRQNSFSDLIIATLFSARSSRAFYTILREKSFKNVNKGTLRNTFSRLKRKNMLNCKNGLWSLTEKGIKKMRDHERFSLLSSPFAKNAPNAVIVSFDVREYMRRERKWLRDQLKNFGFKMLHQSLWIGPGPLPQNFKNKITQLELKESIKIFRLAK